MGGLDTTRTLLVLAILVGWTTALPAGADPTLYHSPADDGAPAGAPVALQPGEEANLFVYLALDPVVSGPNSVICEDGDGDEVCGFLVEVAAEGLLSISDFIPDAGLDVPLWDGTPGLVWSTSPALLRVGRVRASAPTGGPPGHAAGSVLRIGTLAVMSLGAGSIAPTPGSQALGASLQTLGVSRGVLAVPEPGLPVALAAGLALLLLLDRRRRGRRVPMQALLRSVVVVGIVAAGGARADGIDFESGFIEGDPVAAVVTATNKVTFEVGAGGDATVAAVGDPVFAFGPSDTPASACCGALFLTDGGPGVAESYFFSFASPVTSLAIDLLDYAGDEGGAGPGSTAALSVFADAARTVLLASTQFVVSPALPDGFVTTLEIDLAAPFRGASLVFSDPDPGTGIDNVVFESLPLTAEAQKLLASDGVGGDVFGSAVSLGGGHLLVGAPRHPGTGSAQGAVYAFERDAAGAWVEQQKITSPASQSGDGFGAAVAHSGSWAAVGAPDYDKKGNTDSGLVHVFSFSLQGGSWVEVLQLTVSPTPGDAFGTAVALVDDLLVVGVPFDDPAAGTDAGSVHLFRESGGAWTLEASLGASDASPGAAFGSAVWTDGDLVLVGAPDDPEKGSEAGKVYVFRDEGNGWFEQAKLVAANTDGSDHFGAAVAGGTDAAVIGAPDDEGGGAVYVFEYASGWIEAQQLVPSDAAVGQRFGHAVAMEPGLVLVGDGNNDVSGSNSGRAYLFTEVSGSWVEVRRLAASDRLTKDLLGSAVALRGVTAVAGAPGRDDLGNGSGAAYAFDVIGQPAPPSSDPQIDALDALDQASTEPFEVAFEAAGSIFMTGRIPVSGSPSSDPVDVGATFLEAHRPAFDIGDPDLRFFAERRHIDPDAHTVVVFGQQRFGVPVFGAQIAVWVDGSDVLAAYGEHATELAVAGPPDPTLSRQDVIGVIEGVAGPVIRVAGEPRLYYLDKSLQGDPQGSVPRLAWRVVFEALNDGGDWFVDARTGAVLLTLPTEFTGDRPAEDFEIYTVNGDTSNSCWQYSNNDVLWFSENGPVGGASPDADGFVAFNALHGAYHFWFDTFGMRSYDGDGENVWMHLDVGFSPSNARYHSAPGDCFDFSDGFETNDVVGHEWTHGIIRNGDGPDLIYENQPGAVNEHYADFFGEMAEETLTATSTDWLVGNLITAPDRTPPLRNMSDPPLRGDPDHVLPNVSGDMIGLRPAVSDPKRSNDYGGVHVNSGIPNKVAYLLSDGDTHTGRTIDALGIYMDRRGIAVRRTVRLYRDALFAHTKSMGFASHRRVTLAKAQRYVDDGGRYGFTQDDVCNVQNAFASVGLGNSDLDCDGVDDEPDVDGDGVVDADDSCPFDWDPRNINSDFDAPGDACDPDDDNDMICDEPVAQPPGTPGAMLGCIAHPLGLPDNCRTVINPGQEDHDLDGIGDQCDDADGDGILDFEDNCARSSDTTDTDGDGVGDFCDPDDDNDGVCDTTYLFTVRPGAEMGCVGPDNCPLVANDDQLDGDMDGFGDACDLCPVVASAANGDIDGDEVGDACDPDVDDDGVCNEGVSLPDTEPGVPSDGCTPGATGIGDNCPNDYNPDQIDFAGSSLGLACDPLEAELLSGSFADTLAGLVRFIDLQTPVRMRFDPCIAALCPEVLPAGFASNIEIDFPYATIARVVDDRGYTLSQQIVDTGSPLHFRPAPSFHYVEPTALQGTAYQGRSYFIEILPSVQTPIGMDLPISLQTISSAEVCGDSSRDSYVNSVDVTTVLESLADGLPLPQEGIDRCDVGGAPGQCGLLEAALIQRAVAEGVATIADACTAAAGP